MTQAIDEPALLRRLREGQDAAFSELFEEHAPAVRRLALGLAKDRNEAEDITAETFFRVLRAVKRGSGPTDNIRAYLLTVARRVSWEWKGAVQDVPVTDDELTSRAGAAESNPSRAAEHSLITKAFTSLPERWRTVLWQTEVEGAKPAVVAPQIGLSPNATAALARRARLGLRAAYLQAHLATTRSEGGCRSVLEKLGGYTAGSVTGAEADRISAHLASCARCRATHDELRDVCFSLRANANGIAVAGVAAATDAGAAGTTGAAGATGAAATSGASASWSGAVKTAFTSAKVKVGIAVASTAAAGVFGFSVGPAMTEYAGEYFGLVGEQGISQTTSDSEPSLERGPDNGYPVPDASRTRDGESSTHETRRTRERDDRPLQQASPTPESTLPSPEPATALPEQEKSHVDVAGGAKPRTKVTPDAPSKRPGGPRSTEPPPRTEPSKRSAPPSDEKPPATSDTSPSTSPNQGPGPGRSSYEKCVDDYYYTDTYNERRNRREVHEFSYTDGEGYEVYEYYYDNGRYESYEYYWYDSCP
ncbi:sigma-70 family RNA polymerase sigma factor [Haloechinothrix salitolerans]|uniref:Sigma-70 family RNA polymerase sigma factor n=1 Tax=Haloechinothrix salitolerans TaxID=926830 RepID=A0ABW2BSU4_9PSEU